MTEPTFPCFIKKTQINPEFSNFSVYQGWADFRDQSVVCQDISKLPCFVNNTPDISVLIGIFRNSANSVKIPCFVNLLAPPMGKTPYKTGQNDYGTFFSHFQSKLTFLKKYRFLCPIRVTQSDQIFDLIFMNTSPRGGRLCPAQVYTFRY